ncbi:hypothetical protein OF385_02220 [Glutamicibacter sp. JL.03c]|uniref:hypothetical protein n=1 Tax=Glutamicibacter sp. JL.03c TaxID=2984842 RepID=UPI0021F6FCA7|nr:hypothetical protein [Glutamicibacter sp. JL.03c]UYQ78009.1 hypothetical protein OF385_02220 [Glutamicibacter sp. JL.03c]
MLRHWASNAASSSALLPEVGNGGLSITIHLIKLIQFAGNVREAELAVSDAPALGFILIVPGDPPLAVRGPSGLAVVGHRPDHRVLGGRGKVLIAFWIRLRVAALGHGALLDIRVHSQPRMPSHALTAPHSKYHGMTMPAGPCPSVYPGTSQARHELRVSPDAREAALDHLPPARCPAGLE